MKKVDLYFPTASRCCRHANKSADLWFVYRISRVSRYSAVRAVDERSVKGIKRVSESYSHRHSIISLSSRPTSSVYPHCTMSESNSSINSSLIFIAEQSQVLSPSSLRPPTVTSDATFPSSISTPFSPIYSNSSSVGTLKVRDYATFTFHSCLEPDLQPPAVQSPFCRPCLYRRLQLVLRPRPVSSYNWLNTHSGQAFCRRV